MHAADEPPLDGKLQASHSENILEPAAAALNQLSDRGEPRLFELPELCLEKQVDAELPGPTTPDTTTDKANEQASEQADIQVELRIEMGRTKLSRRLLSAIRNGSAIALDSDASQPVDLYAEGRLFGRGEVLVLNDHYCVRVTELL